MADRVAEGGADPRKVCVIHGRNELARKGLLEVLRALGLDPIEWSEAVRITGKGSPCIGEVLDTAFSNAQAAVVLQTPRRRHQSAREPDVRRATTSPPGSSAECAASPAPSPSSMAWPPGRAPVALEDCEYVDFSPPDAFTSVIDHIKAQG